VITSYKRCRICEKRKTAITASLVFPHIVWLASGGKSGPNPHKFHSLRNRTTLLLPDLTKSGEKETRFELWSRDLGRIKGDISGLFEVSDYLENRATDQEKELSLDLADFILLNNWKPENVGNVGNVPSQKHFISEEINPNVGNVGNDLIRKHFILEDTKDYISQLYFENGMLMNDMNYPADWDLVGSYTFPKTKDFIQMALKNPLLIELRKQFDIKI